MTRAIRNIAIIAHVDHGKTTMVDKLLQCAGTFRSNQQVDERVMDSNALEKERGITILAKNCAVEYEGIHINIIDTPGHAGPDWVINATFDLFDKLGATEDQLDFPVIYASALNGYAGLTDDVEELQKIGNMRAVFDAVIKYVPVREDDAEAPLQLQICSLDYSSYVGKIGVGRVDNFHRVARLPGPADEFLRQEIGGAMPVGAALQNKNLHLNCLLMLVRGFL